MKTLIESLNLFSGYIEGSVKEFKLNEHLKFYKKHPMLLNRDFYLITIDSNDEVKAEVKNLLTKLHIPEAHWGRYFGSNLTIYEFLIELDKDRHIQTTYIIKLIKRQRQKFWMLLFIVPLILLAIFLIVLGIVCVPFILIQVPILIKSLLASAYTFVIGGLGIAFVSSAYTFYENQFDHKKTRKDRNRDNILLALNLFFNVTSCGIWLISAGSLALLSSLVLTLAAVTDVVKELLYLKKELNRNKQITSDENKIDIQLANIRSSYNYKIHRNAAIINSVSALAIFAAIVGIQFLGGSIFFGVIFVSSIVIAYTIKTISLKINERYQRRHLQKELSTVIKSYKANNIELNEIALIEPSIPEENQSYGRPLDFFATSSSKRDEEITDLCYGASLLSAS